MKQLRCFRALQRRVSEKPLFHCASEEKIFVQLWITVSGKGLFGGDDRVVYWKCENDSTLKEKLLIPVTNEAKELALRVAARQRMSDKEKRRRELTGGHCFCFSYGGCC